MPKRTARKPLVIGGQAVIGGVMMRGPRWVSLAVRDPDGLIRVKTRRFTAITRRHAWLAIPVVRGVATMGETLWLGIRVLNESAQIASGDAKPVSRREMGLALAVSLVAAVALFKLLPLWLASLVAAQNLWLNIVDGLVKLALFVGYVALIGRMADVRAVFQYHGAEHKAVNCYEAGRPLSAAEAKAFTTAQPRCGTTFVFFVIFLSIFVNMFIPWSATFWAKFGLRLLLLPLVAGLAYEIVRLGASHGRAAWFRLFISPGMLMQRLTTLEPDKAQLEVGVAALRAVLEREGALGPEAIAVKASAAAPA